MRAADPMSHLRACAWCTGWFLAHAGRWDEPYWCPRCHKRRMAGFDPQPGDLVRRVDQQAGGAFTHLLVVARDGDMVTVQPLGFPEYRSTEHVAGLVPNGMPHRRTRG